MINYGDFMRIGLFDSGVGGLTVLRSLVERYPNNEYIYYGDTLNIPYGSKSTDELLELASKNIEFLLEKGAEVIVVACGTVSSNCIFYLRDKYFLSRIFPSQILLFQDRAFRCPSSRLYLGFLLFSA